VYTEGNPGVTEAMTATEEPRVEIEDELRQDERLGPAIAAASDYFWKEVESRPGIVPPNGRLRWSVGRYPSGGKCLVRTYTEPNDDGTTQGVLKTQFSSPEHLLDPVNRDVSMLRLLHEILAWRLEAVDARIRDHLSELDREEERGLAS